MLLHMIFLRTLHYSYISLSLHGFLASPCIRGETKMQGKDTREGNLDVTGLRLGM